MIGELRSFYAIAGARGQLSIAELQELTLGLMRTVRQLDSRERLIADGAGELLFCFDAQLRVLSVNLAVSRVSGYMPEELIGKTIIDLVLPEDVERSASMIDLARGQKQATSFENRILSKSQHAIDLAWTLEWSDTQTCFFASAKDISDQKRLERAKKEFVAMIGHDIRAPLSSALAGMQTVHVGAYGQLSEQACDVLDQAECSLNRLVDLIDELLDLEKIAAGKVVLKMGNIALPEVMRAVLRDTVPLAQAKKIEIVSRVAELIVRADQGKLVRVLAPALTTGRTLMRRLSCQNNKIPRRSDRYVPV